MSRKVIQTESAPSAIGTYSQGIRTDHLIYTSGQIPLDPQNGKLITDKILLKASGVCA